MKTLFRFSPMSAARTAGLPNRHATPRALNRLVAPLILASGLIGVSVGCGGNVSRGVDTVTGPTPASYIFLTGNWEIDTTPTNAVNPFTLLSGFVKEETNAPGTHDLATAVLQAPGSICNLGAIPLSGAVNGASVSFRSFSIDGQYVTLTAAKDATATHVTGTYSIGGGCANGATGNITGTRYSDLNGTFAGPIDGTSPPKGVQLVLAQPTQGTGTGAFLETGTATFTGFTCFTKGTMASGAGTVVGRNVSLSFTTDDPGSAKLLLTGTLDVASDTITAASVVVQSGSCAGSYGTATLNLKN